MVLNGRGVGRRMTYELVAICDSCATRVTFKVDELGKRSRGRPLPAGWTHVHEGGKPGVITPEIGIACSRACLSKARQILNERRAHERKRSPEKRRA